MMMMVGDSPWEMQFSYTKAPQIHWPPAKTRAEIRGKLPAPSTPDFWERERATPTGLPPLD